MSRLQSGDTVYVKARNNIYTVLAVAAFVAVALGIYVIWTRYGSLFPGEKLFGS